jgi:hypothetical protein
LQGISLFWGLFRYFGSQSTSKFKGLQPNSLNDRAGNFFGHSREFIRPSREIQKVGRFIEIDPPFVDLTIERWQRLAGAMSDRTNRMPLSAWRAAAAATVEKLVPSVSVGGVSQSNPTTLVRVTLVCTFRLRAVEDAGSDRAAPVSGTDLIQILFREGCRGCGWRDGPLPTGS